MQFRDEKILLAFGKHLKNLRNRAGVSQEELAYSSGISLSQIARIETGRINPTLCTITTLAKFLNVHPSEMMQYISL